MAAGTLSLASTDITAWVGGFMFPFFRIMAFVAAAPVLGVRNVPGHVKLGIAVILTMVIVPLLGPGPAVDPLSGTAVLVTLHQILIGSAMGLALQMVFNVFVTAGQLIAYQMGLGFASMVDPNSGTEVPVISQFYVVVVTLVFFAIGGHLVMIEVLVESFRTLPVAPQGISTDGLWTLVLWGGELYAGAVQIALPAIAAILVLNLTFGVVTRAAPQFNIFSVGFPLTIIMGFLIIGVTASSIIPKIGDFLAIGFNLIHAVLSQ